MWLKECELVGDVSVSFTFAQCAKRYLPTLQSTTTTSDTYVHTYMCKVCAVHTFKGFVDFLFACVCSNTTAVWHFMSLLYLRLHRNTYKP